MTKFLKFQYRDSDARKLLQEKIAKKGLMEDTGSELDLKNSHHQDRKEEAPVPSERVGKVCSGMKNRSARQPEQRACRGHTTHASSVRDRQGNRPAEDIQIREVDRRREQTWTPTGERGGVG